MEKVRVLSRSIFEEKIGFSRAVRVGNHIAVSGTAPISEDGKSACPGDPYGQTIRCLEIIDQAIQKAGGRLEDVVRTRIYLSDIDNWEKIGQAHQVYFKKIKPACTMVEISRLLKTDWLVEIEADCIVTSIESNSRDK